MKFEVEYIQRLAVFPGEHHVRTLSLQLTDLLLLHIYDQRDPTRAEMTCLRFPKLTCFSAKNKRSSAYRCSGCER
ncbi:hypothetical protein QQF64_010656 [Cirrhinus molitorella]|uniref:Uncharacterized protein n=1 Tax=Cirrhinus molitorella TaxID=172907 RepID=A0ABR3M0J8_9TELE